ncbi:MAG: lysophospholipid acyltransferase family protein [bacterium]|jgi:1-acyl-sn-glycerol-3-phosphate acyltransferase|nr:1-acyl-sn-glycerol-3-phosphate acyltransferase [Betaproteobacteria bacterium]
MSCADRHGVFVRTWRIARATGLMVRGLLIALLLLDRPDVRLRNRHMQPWSAALLDVMDIGLDVHGELPGDDAPVFIAANHVSWLDIWVINAVCPTLFVAKSEIRGWPVFGWLAARVGTLFIERARRADTRKVNDRIIARLAIAGERIAVFPEGTTTDGSVVRPFHASLFQPAVGAGARVHPVAIRYVDTAGVRSDVPAYIDEVSLLASMWRIAGAQGLRAELHFLEPIEAPSPGNGRSGSGRSGTRADAAGPADPADAANIRVQRRTLAALAQERVAAVVAGGGRSTDGA